MIISLPLTIRNDAPLGYWLTPILVDTFGSQIRDKVAIYYGNLGRQQPKDADKRQFLQNLNVLRISRDVVPDQSHEHDLRACCRQALALGTITKVQRCYTCSCGALALPIQMKEYAKEKTFRRTGGSIICKACEEESTVKDVALEVLYPRPVTSLDFIQIQPEFYRKESVGLFVQIQENGITVSRNGTLDIDFVWSFIPLLLSQSGECVRVIITNHVLRQAIVALMLAKLLKPDFQAQLVVSPCIEHPGNIEKWNMERLIALGYTGELLRTMLVGSLGWNCKDAKLYEAPAFIEYRRFELFRRHIVSLSPKNVISLADSIKSLSQQTVARGLQSVFNPSSFDYSQLIGLLGTDLSD